MHELFLTASIANNDLTRAVRILQGFCGMKPQAFLCRRLIWEGPKQRTGLKGIPNDIIAKQTPQKVQLWKTLHEQLVRQSYVVTLVYDVDKGAFGQSTEQQDGQGNQSLRPNCDQSLGTLRWNELPDPVDARPVNTRAMLQIDNEKGLCSTMKSIGYRFTGQMIQECYRFINGNVIFDLSRYLQLPNETQAFDYNTPLPVFDTFTPFDAENKWILMISVRVVNGNDPDQAQQAVSDLMTTRTEFEGCFNFHMVARLTMDTRTRMT